MDATQFDQFAQSLAGVTRRGLLGHLTAMPLLGGLTALVDRDGAEAKKKKKKKKKKGKKKVTLCQGGQTIQVSKKKSKKYLSNGATSGACPSVPPPSPPPPPPPGGCIGPNPANALQAAIDAASSGATIELCAGTFLRPSTNDPVASIVGKNLTLIGSGAEQTILSGGGVSSTLPVVEVLNTSTGNPVTVVLQQMTVTGAKDIPGIGLGSLGAFVSGAGNSLTLAQVTVRDNDNDAPGGGIVKFEGTLILDAGTHVRSNNTSDIGGGIYNRAGNLTLNDGARVSDNDAAKRGGGIYNSVEGTVTLKNGARVSGNEAKGIGITPGLSLGGGIYSQGTVTLEVGSLICDNTPEDCAGTNHLAWSPEICSNSQCPG